ncbi:hypothetical protein FS837_010947 [Tulasnella sp. UAMH 9824]|nr:hypothetical protein FS837_010947 [Tulasnella sp. UAMH 9824]
MPFNTSIATEADSQPFDIFNGSADRLEEVSVNSACLLWDSPILHGLKSLRLHSCRPIQVSNVIAVLSHSPDLNTLILDHTEITVDMQTDSLKALDIARLESLTLVARELRGIREIIKGFRAPNCQTFELWLDTEEPEDTEDFILTILAPYFPFFRRTMLEHPKPVINKSHEDIFDIRCSHDTEAEENVLLSLFLAETPTDVLMAFLLQVLGLGGSGKPDVRLIIGRDWGTEGLAILSEVPLYCNVVDLWLGAHSSFREFGTEDTLRCLTMPEILPHLRRLIVAGDGWDGGELAAVLQNRYDQADEDTPPLRIHLIGRGVNTDYTVIWRLKEIPQIEEVSWSESSKIMDLKYQYGSLRLLVKTPANGTHDTQALGAVLASSKVLVNPPPEASLYREYEAYP